MQFSNPTDIFMRIVNINYPKEEVDENKLIQLISNYKKRCEPGVLKHMSDVSLIEFKPRTDNFSQATFTRQLSLLLKR